MYKSRPFDAELKPDEIILWQGRPAKRVVPNTLRPFAWTAILILAVGLTFFARLDPTSWPWDAGIFLTFASLFWVVTNTDPILMERYAITDRQILASLPDEGSSRIVRLPLSQLQNLDVKLGAGGIGTIVCAGPGQEAVTFHSVEEALDVANIIRGA